MDTQTLWKNGSRIVLVVVAVGALGFIAGKLRAGSNESARPKDKLASERTAIARHGGPDARMPLAAPGTIAGGAIIEPAQREIRLGAPVAALVRHILVKEGESVSAGQPLIELDDDTERAQLDSARAAVKSAEAQLARTREGRRPEDVRAAEADARAAKARAALSRLEYERDAALRDKGASTPDELDRARFTADIDEATRLAQESRFDAARTGWHRDVEVAADALAEAEGRLAEAQARYDRLTVKAPMAGTVLQMIVREGEYQNPAGTSPLLTLGDLRTLRARVDVDERDVAGVRLGQGGYVTVDAFGERKFAGHVTEIGRRMGRKNLRTDEPTERIDTHILEVVLTLEDGHELVPGLRAYGYLDASAPLAAR